MSAKPSRQILICGRQFEDELSSGALASVVDLAQIAARLGAQGVEFRDVYWKDKANELPAARGEMARLGLTTTYATTTTLYNRDSQQQAQLRADLEDAYALGAGLIRVFRGDPPGNGPDDAPVREAARSVIERAGELGVRLALENHSGNQGSRLADVKETLERLDTPVLGANVDIANYAVNGQDPLEAIHALSPWIIYAHLKDAKPSPDGKLKQTYLGDGILPLGELVAALEGVGRPVPFCFEFRGNGDPEGTIARSMALLARL